MSLSESKRMLLIRNTTGEANNQAINKAENMVRLKSLKMRVVKAALQRHTS